MTDASYIAHPDSKGPHWWEQLGKGAIISWSNKQKLNVMSSTEGELVSAHEVLPTTLLSKYFIEAQGYDVEQMILYQDSQDMMRLKVNCQFSSTKWTKHINAWYFFITDHIEKRDIEVYYCPNEMMWVNILDNPKLLQSTRWW